MTSGIYVLFVSILLVSKVAAQGFDFHSLSTFFLLI